MPYITEHIRESIMNDLYVPQVTLENPGNLNYTLTTIINKYTDCNGESYKTFNDIIGVLECAKQELYRRVVSSYEDKKCQENGDVYPLIDTLERKTKK